MRHSVVSRTSTVECLQVLSGSRAADHAVWRDGYPGLCACVDDACTLLPWLITNTEEPLLTFDKTLAL